MIASSPPGGDPTEIEGELRTRIDREIARFPERRGALLGALRAIQEEHGWISPALAVEIASIFELRPVEVMELVHFYNMLDAKPGGRHRVRVCTSLSCALRGAAALLRALESHLGVSAGGTTQDGRIHLAREECLGACAWAPMMRVDDRYHEDLDPERARAIVDALE